MSTTSSSFSLVNHLLSYCGLIKFVLTTSSSLSLVNVLWSYCGLIMFVLTTSSSFSLVNHLGSEKSHMTDGIEDKIVYCPC